MIKVKYNSETTLVEGYFPDNINYPNNDIDIVNKTIDGQPYIEIEADQQVISKQMCVVDDVYQEFVPTPEVQLQEAKDAKLAQLDTNKNNNLIKDLISEQGYETYKDPSIPWNGTWIVGDKLLYFHFKTETTGVPITEPENILRRVQDNPAQVIQYSCYIVDDGDLGLRKGYINLDATLASSLANHCLDRGNTSIQFANEQQIKINDCKTIEEVDAIDINFNNIN